MHPKIPRIIINIIFPPHFEYTPTNNNETMKN